MPSTSPQILQVDPPSDLVFRGPFFTEQVVVHLSLRNPPRSNQHVLFKIKTTAPRRYVVRPNSGLLAPGSESRVNIMLQPFSNDPALSSDRSAVQKLKHKFMVQSMIVDNDESDVISGRASTSDMDKLWETATPSRVMDTRLRCCFSFDEDGGDGGDVVKMSRANGAANKETSAPPTGEVNGLRAQVRQLEEQVRSLRSENSSLSSAGGMRHRAGPARGASQSSPTFSGGVDGQGGTAISSFPVPPIVFIVAAVIMGLILGKFIL